ncbi:MAG TPA: divalent-cation tolerance protein CutA [Saprospiraceae bacterium]|nr:divalent-cation tolerance protein CutA [Saprospiraceae bacterium]HNT22075.1 divalent-cation tolerance protein CutA [Saprospiraceae bacterium]
MKTILEVQVTFPDETKAREICNQVIVEKLAACANIFPVQSRYIWKENFLEETEYAALLKTDPEALVALTDRIKTLHPYEVPAITCWHTLAIPEYADWVYECCRKPD